MVRAMVHSTKHYVQFSLENVTVGTRSNNVIIDSVAVADKTTPAEVEEGSTVKAVYFEMWAIGSSSNQFFTAVLMKLPSGLGNPTFAEMALLNDLAGKKDILYTTQGLAANDGISIPLPVYKGWIKIPKSKQRFGLGDSFNFLLASRGDATVTICGFATYKEYS